VVARRRWNPTLHPRDKNGRFTRSGTRELKKGDRVNAASVMAGFRPKRGVTGAKAGGYLSGIAPARQGRSGGGAVDRYLNQGGFVDVHKALRAGKAADNADVAELDAAMIELPDDLLVSRRVPVSMFGDVAPDQLVGMKVRDAAYSPVSLSTVPGRADDVRMRIAVPAGTRAIVAPETGELILDRDLEMAVASVEKNSAGGWDMHLVVLPKDGAPPGSGPQPGPAGTDTAPADDDADAALRAELMRLRVPELQRRARDRGLKPGKRRKSQLVDLIVADERGGTEPADNTPQPGDTATGPLVGDAARAAAPVSIARRRSRGALTRAERQALVDYKGALYMSANNTLRRERGQIPDTPEYRTLARRIRTIDTAVAKSPLTADVQVTRGVKVGRAVFGEAWDRDLTGAEWTEHAYLSTSTSDKTAGLFSDLGHRDAAKMRILVPAGTPAVELSGSGDEAELLLRRGLRMRVVSDTGPGENRELAVEVVPDDQPGAADATDRPGRDAAGVGGGGAGSGAAADDDGLSGRGGTPTTGPIAAAARSARVEGRDLAEEIRENAMEIYTHDTGATRDRDALPWDGMLAELARRQGFDAPPQLVSSADMDAAVGSGWVEVWRGDQPAVAESLKRGQFRPGKGVYGNGVYTSTSRATGERFAETARNRHGAGEVLRIAVDPQARIADHAELVEEFKQWRRAEVGRLADGELGRQPRDTAEAMRRIFRGDVARYAAMRGYDGYRVSGMDDGGPRTADGEFADQLVIVNRSVLMIEDDDGR
jgi:hypothetical protein